MRRICRGSLPLQAEVQATLCNPSRPWSQPRDQLTRTARGSGGIACFDSPGGFPPISPGESGLPAAGKGKWQKARTHQAPPTVCQRQTPPSEREAERNAAAGQAFSAWVGTRPSTEKDPGKSCYGLLRVVKDYLALLRHLCYDDNVQTNVLLEERGGGLWGPMGSPGIMPCSPLQGNMHAV